MQPTIVFLSGLFILALLFWYLASDDISRKRKVGTVLILGIIVMCGWSLSPRTETSEFLAGDITEMADGTGYQLSVTAILAKDAKGEDLEMEQDDAYYSNNAGSEKETGVDERYTAANLSHC